MYIIWRGNKREENKRESERRRGRTATSRSATPEFDCLGVYDGPKETRPKLGINGVGFSGALSPATHTPDTAPASASASARFPDPAVRSPSDASAALRHRRSPRTPLLPDILRRPIGAARDVIFCVPLAGEMITWEDFYTVMCAMVPLYFAMFVAYGSVKWWKIFTPEQCSGINRFVATFAVPVLSFHFISHNNPYQMDSRFILADTLSKLLVLVILSVWASLSAACAGRRRRAGRLDWVITLFSVGTLPNTLVMGIPLLRAMYGDFTQSLMVQLVVLQCIIWYPADGYSHVCGRLSSAEETDLFAMYVDQFPGTAAAAIAKFDVDGDIISLDGRDPIRAESEVDADGRIRVRIRRSISSALDSGLSSSLGITPRRLSNISGAEIYSVNTPVRQPASADRFTVRDITLGCRSASPHLSGYASSDSYSLQPTPRASNFNEMEISTPVWVRSPAAPAGLLIRQQSPGAPGALKLAWEGCGGQGDKDVGDLSFRSTSKFVVDKEDEEEELEVEGDQEMPAAFVMLRLILTVLGRKLSRNPNTYSSILGLLWSLISFKYALCMHMAQEYLLLATDERVDLFRWGVNMPTLVKESIKIISDAGLGMAMFSLGEHGILLLR
ncbi:hypothetical protein BHE74_00053617 [Ensete ventricosum]|nr:hypothetical protein BHE74_00053617 [Ensete ventricosum]